MSSAHRNNHALTPHASYVHRERGNPTDGTLRLFGRTLKGKRFEPNQSLQTNAKSEIITTGFVAPVDGGPAGVSGSIQYADAGGLHASTPNMVYDEKTEDITLNGAEFKNAEGSVHITPLVGDKRAVHCRVGSGISYYGLAGANHITWRAPDVVPADTTYLLPSTAVPVGGHLQNNGGAPASLTWELPQLPVAYLEGFQITDATTSSKSVSAGSCRSDDDTLDIVSSGTLTPSIASSGANGLDTGSEAADTWYSIWVIADSNGVNPVASLLSVSETAPTFPAGYDKKRRVGWVRNNGSSNFYDYFSQHTGRDRLFLWGEEEFTLEILTNGSATSWSTVSLDEFVPPTSELAYLAVNHTSGTTEDFVQLRPGAFGINTSITRVYGGNTSGNAHFYIQTDNEQDIQYENSSSFEETDIKVHGYVDSL